MYNLKQLYMKKPASKAFATIESPKLELKANEKNLSLTMELFIKTVLSSSEYIDKSNEEKSIENILLIVSIIV